MKYRIVHDPRRKLYIVEYKGWYFWHLAVLRETMEEITWAFFDSEQAARQWIAKQALEREVIAEITI